MPKSKITDNPKPLYPIQHVNVHLPPSGSVFPFVVFTDSLSEKEFLQCDICDQFVRLSSKRSPVGFVKHRESKDCMREVEKRERRVRQDVQDQVVAEASKMHSWAFQTSVVADLTPLSSSSATPMPLTPMNIPSNFTPRMSTPHSELPFLDELSLDNFFHPSTETAAGVSPLNTSIDYFDDSEPEDDFEDETTTSQVLEANACTGQLVAWIPGSVWETYGYHQHADNSLPWVLLSVENSQWIRIQSRRCKIFLDSNQEFLARTCSQCQALLNSAQLQKFMERAKGDAPAHTPWKYLNNAQIIRMAMTLRRRNSLIMLENLNLKRKVGILKKKLNDNQRLVMLLSQHKIGGVSRILATAFRNGAGIQAVYSKLQLAVMGAYRPRSGWTARELDVAFLIKAHGGSRLLYAAQQEDSYPSRTTLERRKPIPELTVSVSIPSNVEIKANISAFLGQSGRKPPYNKLVGQAFLIDDVATEEVPRYDFTRNCILGLCREHSADIKTRIDTLEDLDAVEHALQVTKLCHHGKEATVAALAPVTANENYFPVPLIVSTSCKAEKGDALAKWVSKFLDAYKESADGEGRHGPIKIIATDGAASFRKLRFTLGLSEDLNRDSALGKILYSLPGFNCRTGPNQLLGTCDPKHIIKRFATLIRSPSGIQIGDTQILSSDVFKALNHLEGMTPQKAELLLNPADKQNVPKAVNLLQSLFDLEGSKIIANPAIIQRIRKIVFLAQVLSYFLFPFIHVNMSLSQQIRSLSTYVHLVTALYIKHKAGFLTTPLFADSQAIVKCIILTAARLQLIDPSLHYYILFEGTDRLEGVFSHTRTQDHARNFDVTQLAYKLSIGAEINAVYERNPDLDRGHIRRNLVNARGIDHINPKSWTGDVVVGNINIRQEYLAGREEANQLLSSHFGPTGIIDFDDLFASSDIDHLRPLGDYIGSRAVDGQDEDDDNDMVTGDLLERDSEADLNHPKDDLEDCSTANVNTDTIDPDTEPMPLNPPEQPHSHYFIVSEKKIYKPVIIAERLTSDRARKATARPLRAQGVTVEELLRRRTQQINQPDTDGFNDGQILAGDIGALLTRVGRNVCLAVAEVLNFRQGSSKNNLAAINEDDLDPKNSKSTTIAVQFLHLSAQVINHERVWIWPKKYLQVQPNKEKAVTQRNFAMRIPGELFYPLAAQIHYENDDIPVWKILNSDLTDILEDAWSSLNPEDDEIINNIKLLPKIDGPDLPYTYFDATTDTNHSLCIKNLPVELDPIKLNGTDKFPCRICADIVALKSMRNHVGKHILRALRGSPDPSLKNGIEIGINPCGWCGLEGCKTQLGNDGKSVDSNCQYHYERMVYSRAIISTSSGPCTNVPLHCSVCQPGRNGQLHTFWKYNLIHHMTEYHLSDTESLPPCHPDLLIKTHISIAEERLMGIAVEKTLEWREENDIPNSDAIEEFRADSWRKRAASSVSEASSASRQPSPSKLPRFNQG